MRGRCIIHGQGQIENVEHCLFREVYWRHVNKFLTKSVSFLLVFLGIDLIEKIVLKLSFYLFFKCVDTNKQIHVQCAKQILMVRSSEFILSINGSISSGIHGITHNLPR